MIDEDADPDRAGRPDAEAHQSDSEVRTDGGVAVGGNSAARDSPMDPRPTMAATLQGPTSQGSPGEGTETDPSTNEDRPDPDLAVTAPVAAVREQFSQTELTRLRALASSTSAQSAWVIKRLLRHRDD